MSQPPDDEGPQMLPAGAHDGVNPLPGLQGAATERRANRRAWIATGVAVVAAGAAIVSAYFTATKPRRR